jgi:hypothetical protein
VVVAVPFQYQYGHPEGQKVVHVLLKGFEDGRPISEAFTLLPRAFALSEPPIKIRIDARVRASSRWTVLDTARRTDMFLFAKISDASIWSVESSFGSVIDQGPDGTTLVRVHPVRSSNAVQTRVVLHSYSTINAEISGSLSFDDSRCPGVEIVLISAPDVHGTSRSLGIFSPKTSITTFYATVSDQDTNTIALEIRSSPSDPGRIDFCTVVLKRLTAPGTIVGVWLRARRRNEIARCCLVKLL